MPKSITIQAARMFYVDNNSVGQFSPGQSFRFSHWGQLLIGVFAFPDWLRRSKILGGTLNFYADAYTTGSLETFYVWPLVDDPATIQTYRDVTKGFSDKTFNHDVGFRWHSYTYPGLNQSATNGGRDYFSSYFEGIVFGESDWAGDDNHHPGVYTSGSNAPYLVVNYDDMPPTGEALSPLQGFVDRHKEIEFRVNSRTYDSNYQQNVLFAKHAILRYRDGLSGGFREATAYFPSGGSVATWKAPANTFAASQIQWGISRIVSVDNIEAVFSQLYTLSTVDSLSTAVPIEPVNAMIAVGAQNMFRWQHVIATGSDPTGYELQYSADNYTWQALAARTGTAETSCAVAANVLPAGKLWWRVRTYNGDGVAGEWSEPAPVIGYGAPPAPVISDITNSARPTIRWQSATQIAYELIIRQGDTELLRVGETAGTDKSYTVKDFLEDGSYTVFVRIENSGLYWSEWASAAFAVQTQKPDPPAISGTPVKNGVLISAGGTGDALYLLRDGVPIAKMDGGEAADYAAVGRHTYTVRRVTAAGAFADSAPLQLETKIEQAVIAPADDPRRITGPLLQAVENEYPSTANLSTELRYYAGRRYPVAVTDGTITEEYSPVFAALSAAQWQALRGLMEDSAVILYRNSAGDCAYCVIAALNPTKSWNGYMTWETTLQRVDYVERISYDGVV